MPKTLLFVPTYNERDNAPRMARELSALGLDADILFVDDNSPDGTGHLLEELRAEIPRLLVQHRGGKQGIGSAHAEGIAWAYEQGYTRLVTLDCDFTHSPADVPRMLAASEDYDLAVGSRWLTCDSLPGWNPFRRFMTFAGHAMTKYVLGIPQDASGAFRAYRLDRIPRELFGLIHSKSYGFFFESMFVFNRNKRFINQVPITLPARTYGNSKMSARAAWSSARYIFELALENIRRPERFLRPTTPVAWDSSLQDPQNWDAYWNASGQKGNPVYETIAGIYRRGVIKKNLERVIRREFAPGSALLHAGCGSGQVDTGLQNEMRITGLDISRGALNLYARNNQKAEAIVPGSIFALPFDGEHFDGVYNLGVMEHFTAEEIGRILAEFRRVLKPGGTAVLFWPHACAPSVWVLRACHAVLSLFSKKPVQLHPPEISLLVSREDVRQRVEAAGFRLAGFDYGPRDFWIQAAVVCKKT